MRGSVTVPDADVEAFYKQNLAAVLRRPTQARASHILFKTEGKDENAVREQAETAEEGAKAGADFAALARSIPKTRQQGQGR